ncbi:hypothetical protein WA026_004129 [Henosepilachna vigintioctopunctata]|uniref:Uncharacterized protein n=1 Tax=Henosepilachna vigintioctopunctata TaxID=420089 RepID=A0AAW1UF15_9CUCU
MEQVCSDENLNSQTGGERKIILNLSHEILLWWLASVFDPESYAGGSLATGRVTQAGQVGEETPDEEEHPGPPGWGLGVRLTTSPRKKKTSSEISRS